MSTPEFPRCTVKGHDHPLTVVQRHVQQQTGEVAHTLECPTGRYRFFYLPRVWESLGTMARTTRPRYGWKATA